MLFNSLNFIFIFLPLTLIGFYILGAYNFYRSAIFWLVLASTVFYGYFNLKYLVLLGVLIIINYLLGMKLSRQYQAGVKNRLLLLLGIIINLSVLFYYKYTNFIITNVNTLLQTNYILHTIILPIGISFFIFQKIAYLVDSYHGKAEEYNFLDFCLFVMYFPQLIAGPIVHHKDLMPQFRQLTIFKLNYSDLSAGIMMFVIGLCKKNLIADTLSTWVQPVFSAAQQGYKLTFLEAWGGALGFTLQIYFDFSAYSDMALGLALMIGIRLPTNFNSPYKANNIVDFWRCWHISLSNFLRDYIYIPLGGNRNGKIRRYVNLLLTMLIGGFWHGAAWTFVIWGALHGFYLIVNHGWRLLKAKFNLDKRLVKITILPSRLITFLSVVVAWVFFRAESFKGALNLLEGMIGVNGIVIPVTAQFKTPHTVIFLLNYLEIKLTPNNLAYLYGAKQVIFLLSSLLVVWILPNTLQLCSQFKPSLNPIQPIKFSKFWKNILDTRVGDNDIVILTASGAIGLLFALILISIFVREIFNTTTLTNFIYFQF